MNKVVLRLVCFLWVPEFCTANVLTFAFILFCMSRTFAQGVCSSKPTFPGEMFVCLDLFTMLLPILREGHGVAVHSVLPPSVTLNFQVRTIKKHFYCARVRYIMSFIFFFCYSFWLRGSVGGAASTTSLFLSLPLLWLTERRCAVCIALYCMACRVHFLFSKKNPSSF